MLARLIGRLRIRQDFRNTQSALFSESLFRYVAGVKNHSTWHQSVRDWDSETLRVSLSSCSSVCFCRSLHRWVSSELLLCCSVFRVGGFWNPVQVPEDAMN